MKDPEYTRPIGDDRLWLKNNLDLEYRGEEPEKHSPANRDAELKGLREVLFGVRFPRTSFERQWLRYMGGIQEEPPPKWIKCRKCECEFKAAGFPAPKGPPNYPVVCQSCADQEDAKLGGRRIAPKKPVRSVYND